jgi:hypothetical protein
MISAPDMSPKQGFPACSRFRHVKNSSLFLKNPRVSARGILETGFTCGASLNFQTFAARGAITLEEILTAAAFMKKQGALTVVLQSGEDPGSDGLVIEAAKKIKNDLNMAITLSVGERDSKIYREFLKAGADRYLLRIETTDPGLFKKLHPDDDLEYREQCLFSLKKLGFEVGTGIMVGLPGQSLGSIARDLLFFKKLDPAMVGIGPFAARAQKQRYFPDVENAGPDPAAPADVEPAGHHRHGHHRPNGEAAGAPHRRERHHAEFHAV